MATRGYGKLETISQRRIRQVAGALSLATMLCTLPVPATATESDLATAKQDIANQNYDKAYQSLMILSKKGVPEAYYQLASLYDHGLGRSADKDMAHELYIKAASTLPKTGRHAHEDLNRKALERSTAVEEQLKLARCYELGIDGSVDHKKALELYQQLADKNVAEAMNNLGYMYQCGLGVAPDDEKAAQFYQKAADQGSMQAANNLGYLYYKGLGVKQDMAQARALFEKAVQAGEPGAMTNLGWMYVQGKGVKQDFDKAIALFSEAASRGMPIARFNLGYVVEYGLGTKRNPADSDELYRIAATEMANGGKARLVGENTLTFMGKRSMVAGPHTSPTK